MDHNVRFPDAEKVKTHFRKNKKFYIGFGFGALIILAVRKPVYIINTVSPVFNNNNSVELGGHLRKIVYCTEQNKYWPSVTEAATSAGVAQALMSKHLNEHVGHDTIKGLHYKIIGVAN